MGRRSPFKNTATLQVQHFQRRLMILAPSSKGAFQNGQLCGRQLSCKDVWRGCTQLRYDNGFQCKRSCEGKGLKCFSCLFRMGQKQQAYTEKEWARLGISDLLSLWGWSYLLCRLPAEVVKTFHCCKIFGTDETDSCHERSRLSQSH